MGLRTDTFFEFIRGLMYNALIVQKSAKQTKNWIESNWKPRYTSEPKVLGINNYSKEFSDLLTEPKTERWNEGLAYKYWRIELNRTKKKTNSWENFSLLHYFFFILNFGFFIGSVSVRFSFLFGWKIPEPLTSLKKLWNYANHCTKNLSHPSNKKKLY